MTGVLIHNGDRPDIVFDNGALYGGLHCGECFDVYVNQWISVRLEYLDDWIIVCEGKSYPLSYGLPVKI